MRSFKPTKPGNFRLAVKTLGAVLLSSAVTADIIQHNPFAASMLVVSASCGITRLESHKEQFYLIGLGNKGQKGFIRCQVMRVWSLSIGRLFPVASKRL